MFTSLDPQFRDSLDGAEALSILRTCVHCGFCLATCPTYQLLGDELDSPRGRIYLMKNMLEGQPVSRLTQRHLDRCLTCRSCETTCPSGVQYGRLVDIGRSYAEAHVPRGPLDSFKRVLLKTVLPRPMLFRPLLAVGRVFRPLLPRALRRKIPAYQPPGPWPEARHERRMLVLAGCVQPVLAPDINAAAARVLDRLGISLITAPRAGCCGALAHHLADESEALVAMRRNIDAWWPFVEQGAEAIVVTASGCGTEIKEYGHALRNDPDYSDRARQIAALARDVSQVILEELSDNAMFYNENKRDVSAAIAFQSPCSLQHGQKLKGVVEGLLQSWGARLTAVPDAHLCCGSAGTYSLLQPELARQLQVNKVAALESGKPDLILTANIGCLTHLASATEIPIQHWVEWLDARLLDHHQSHA
ncbi:MAG: glycolate oxidase subunit GlcF [Burkholderiales bacterium]